MIRHVFVPLLLLATILYEPPAHTTRGRKPPPGNLYIKECQRNIGTKECDQCNFYVAKIPRFLFTHQAQRNCLHYPADQVALSMETFYYRWVKKFGDPAGKIRSALDNILIDWTKRRIVLKRAFNLAGTKINYTKVDTTLAAGLTYNSASIWVHPAGKNFDIDESDYKLYQTSLVHELIHICMYVVTDGKHADPDHEGQKYQGWTKEHTELMKEVNLDLKRYNI